MWGQPREIGAHPGRRPRGSSSGRTGMRSCPRGHHRPSRSVLIPRTHSCPHPSSALAIRAAVIATTTAAALVTALPAWSWRCRRRPWLRSRAQPVSPPVRRPGAGRRRDPEPCGVPPPGAGSGGVRHPRALRAHPPGPARRGARGRTRAGRCAGDRGRGRGRPGGPGHAGGERRVGDEPRAEQGRVALPLGRHRARTPSTAPAWSPGRTRARVSRCPAPARRCPGSARRCPGPSCDRATWCSSTGR